MTALEKKEDIQEALLSWFAANRRSLPWRENPDPYHVWVSEIMLQQTRVDTVLPYFERFLTRFPTPRALAAAPIDDVLSIWKGLGYYARARNLHKGARFVVEECGGKLPDELPALLEVPGIGRYTAGAILSIAFQRPVPLLDGNVARVFCRLQTLELNPGSHQGQKVLWELAESLIHRERPGDLNQSLMELGALVCTPRSPQCASCPVRSFCRAAELEDPTEFPRMATKKARPTARAIALALRRPDGAMLFGKRPSKGLLGGMWEWPSCLLREGESVGEGAPRLARERLGLDLPPSGQTVRVVHIFTHLRLELHVMRVELENELAQELVISDCPVRGEGAGRQLEVSYRSQRWVGEEEFVVLPVGRATAKALEAFESARGEGQLQLFGGSGGF